MMLFLLLLCLAALFYIQVGYLAVMWILSRWFSGRQSAAEEMPGKVSIILCVHNGAGRIADRLRNLAACAWTGEREFLVFCDGCTDDTAAEAEASGVDGVRVIRSEVQRGKWAALNEAVAVARHEIIVFADARQTFHPQALQELVGAFQDASVGAVSGLLEIAPSEGGGGQGVDLYWKMERKLREWEGRYDSVIGCTGAIYAIRKQAYQPLESGTILDDVIVPMQIAVEGWRVAYNPQAVAYDPQTLEPAKEKLRKRRTLVGNYQMLERYPRWLLPWHNRLWWQLISHKYARLAVPWLMLAVLLLTLAMPKSPAVLVFLGLQTLCYALAAVGWLFPAWRSKLVTIPSGFLLLQLTCARAFFAYLSSRRDPLSLWKPSSAVPPSSIDLK
jgi:cellulose synthase/poly-beta-1,6-N-acetylglucosamine synthase-like glycosyltransferase